MATSKSFHDFVVHDAMAEINGVTSRRMFGGYGIYLHGVIFALISDEKVYFRVGESNRNEFEKYNSQPFSYAMKGETRIMNSYWQLPSEIFENRTELPQWIEKAYQESLIAKRKK